MGKKPHKDIDVHAIRKLPVGTLLIIECDSTLYVGMTRKKHGGL